MYDIILWGATGFTGRQAARYLHEHYGRYGTIKWAIAGRNAEKLAQTRDWLGATDLEIFIVPGADNASAENLAAATKVVCATVAPAAKYASAMVQACVKQGTDYCDLSGELHWIRDMIDQHDEAAQRSGARILNACGFDSIPSDLGVQLMQKKAMERYGEYCSEIKNCFYQGHIAVSGGSFASGKGVMQAIAVDPKLAQLLANPNSLNPRDKLQGKFNPELDKVAFDQDFDGYLMPFPMGGINTRIVRRSHALTNFQYGEDFVYDEARLVGKGVAAKLKGELETFFTKLFVEGDPNSRFTQFLHGLGPKEGSGPSDEKMKGYGPFSFRMLGKTATGKSIRGYVYSDWDPGHGGTSAMLCETAYCLAKEGEGVKPDGGFTTTSVAMGETLLARLRQHANIDIAMGRWS